MKWFGKPRSKFGCWLDDHGIKQQELSKKSGVSEDTITRLANEDKRLPSRRTGQKLMKVIQEIEPGTKESDFWDV